MYIQRDITTNLLASQSMVQILLGPRQCGKSTLFAFLLEFNKKYGNKFQEVNFDDLHLRQFANRDPSLFLQQYNSPLLLDEIQYVPNLLPELKMVVDSIKRKRAFGSDKVTKISPQFFLTGSNQILMDKNVKESLAGRASYFQLNTLTVHEILTAFPRKKLLEILFKGGWPELYIDSNIGIKNYLNDYIRSYIEKDIVMQAGIQKLNEFHTVLSLLAARTGQLLDLTDIANNSGVKSPTVREWLSLIARSDLAYMLRPFFSNLNKRLTKTPKFYFLDTGLAARLQGWTDSTPLLTSPQIGCLFETLVLAEVIKYIRNYNKDWHVHFWRTKEGEEIDILVETNKNQIHAFECKLSLSGKPVALNYPASYQKIFRPNTPLTIITMAGKHLKLSENCVTMPIADLHDHLQSL